MSGGDLGNGRIECHLEGDTVHFIICCGTAFDAMALYSHINKEMESGHIKLEIKMEDGEYYEDLGPDTETLQ